MCSLLLNHYFLYVQFIHKHELQFALCTVCIALCECADIISTNPPPPHLSQTAPLLYTPIIKPSGVFARPVPSHANGARAAVAASFLAPARACGEPGAAEHLHNTRPLIGPAIAPSGSRGALPGAAVGHTLIITLKAA